MNTLPSTQTCKLALYNTPRDAAHDWLPCVVWCDRVISCENLSEGTLSLAFIPLPMVPSLSIATRTRCLQMFAHFVHVILIKVTSLASITFRRVELAQQLDGISTLFQLSQSRRTPQHNGWRSGRIARMSAYDGRYVNGVGRPGEDAGRDFGGSTIETSLIIVCVILSFAFEISRSFFSRVILGVRPGG